MTRINIELDTELHKKIRLYCIEQGITLIDFVNRVIREKNQEVDDGKHQH